MRKMSELTQEQFEQLPDFVQSDYQEVDGVYKHAGVLKLKGSLNELDSKYKGQVSELNTRLTDFEKNEAAKIEAAKAEALESAKGKGEVEEIERLYQEKMADLETRSYEKGKLEAASEFKMQSAKKDAENLASRIAADLAVDKAAREDLQDLIGLRVKPDESGNITFYNRDGSASTMTESEFVAEIKDRHKRLVKGEANTTGGGLSNGSRNSGAMMNSNKPYSEMTLAEQVAFNSK